MSYDNFYDFNTPIVIDNGSGSLKLGIAGTERPSREIPTLVGTPKHVRVILSTERKEKYYGKDAFDHRGLCKLSSPIQKGVVTDMNDMTQLWEHVYKDCIKVPSEDHPALLTERSNNPVKNRIKTASLFFERFGAPALYFAPTAVLSLYGSGRTSGCVLDSGAGITTCVPIWDGFAIPHAITRMEIGGNDVDKYFEFLLNKSGLKFHTSSELQTIKIIKEKECELQIPNSRKGAGLGTNLLGNLGNNNILSSIDNDDESASPKYTLPDGSQIIIGEARYTAPEILFKPDKIGLEYRGIHYCVLDSINKCDLDLRKNLYGTIVLSGGNTTINQFPRRLVYELQLKSKKAKIKVIAPQERTITPWVGASLLASMSAFRTMWVKKKEFMDDNNVLFRKSFY